MSEFVVNEAKMNLLTAVLKKRQEKQEKVREIQEELNAEAKRIQGFVECNRDNLPIREVEGYKYSRARYFQLNIAKLNIQIRWKETDGIIRNFTIRKWKVWQR